MRIDSELKKEIRTAQGNKERMAIIAFKNKIKAVAAELSKPWQEGEDPNTYTYMKRRYEDSFRRFKRAEIAVCTALTIKYYSKHYEDWSDVPNSTSIAWANEVLDLCNSAIHRENFDLVIRKLHDANEVDHYAKFFIELTTEDVA